MPTKRERYWVCRTCPWWTHRKKDDTSQRCPNCGKHMTKARKFPVALYDRRRAQIKREAARRRREERVDVRSFNVVRAKGKRLGFGRKARISARTRLLFKKALITKDKWSMGRAVERFFKSFAKDIGATEPAVLNWVESEITLGSWRASGNVITLSHKQDDLKTTLAHEAVHWADYVAGISRRPQVGSHSPLFYVRVDWLLSELDK